MLAAIEHLVVINDKCIKMDIFPFLWDSNGGQLVAQRM